MSAFFCSPKAIRSQIFNSRGGLFRCKTPFLMKANKQNIYRIKPPILLKMGQFIAKHHAKSTKTQC